MAYQARQREPLLDQRWQRILERRSQEVFGLILLGCAAILATALLSYSPTDPGLFSSPQGPVRNLLGEFGAALASPFMLSIGLSSWCVVAFLLVWAFRFFGHCSARRFANRLFLLPLTIATGSVYAAAVPPIESWGHHFGQGGMFGDTALAALVSLLPNRLDSFLQHLPAMFAGTTVVIMLLALGVSGREVLGWVRWIFRRFLAPFRGIRRKKKETASPAEEQAETTPSPTVSARKSVRTDNPAMRMKLARARKLNPSMVDDPTPPLTGGHAQARVPVVEEEQEVVDQYVPPEPARKPRRSWLGGVLRRGSGSKGKAVESPGLSGRRPQSEPPLTRSPVQPGFTAPSDTETEPDHRPQSASSSGQQIIRLGYNPATVDQPATQQPDLKRNAGVPPPIDLLQMPDPGSSANHSEASLMADSARLKTVLGDYGIKGEIGRIRPGPVVTLYELKPAPGLKASRVIGLSDDIARSMTALSARVSTVPGRSVIGIELPNPAREKVYLREIVERNSFKSTKLKLPIALGKDIAGDSVVVDLSEMPHLLVAGTTGSGKSVAINTMILSLLYSLSPDQCRLIMIDPKMLELSVYDGIPHLLSPVVTDPKKAIVALKWVVGEMEERYHKMSKLHVRNVHGYNELGRKALAENRKVIRRVQTGFDDRTGEPVYEVEEFEPEILPFIVVIVDEMADLMMVAGKEIEACIQRLAQMARASGIHLIMATQRPSVDVITGTIKANFPTRISFAVSSKIDSRTILEEQGAEQLLGMGDMLYRGKSGKIMRVHGPFVSDGEVEEIVAFLKQQGELKYVSAVAKGASPSVEEKLGLSRGNSDEDEYDKAVQIVKTERKCSTSYIQRRLKIGYNKAARLVEEMESNGLVSEANHLGRREIFIPED